MKQRENIQNNIRLSKDQKNNKFSLTSKAESRKDVHVVALGGDLDGAVGQSHAGERAAGSHDGRAVRPLVGVRCSAFGL